MADLILMNMIHLDKVSHLYQGDLLTAQLPNFYFHYLHNFFCKLSKFSIFFVKVIFFHQHYIHGISVLFFLSHWMIIQVSP